MTESEPETVKLNRDVIAIVVPYGDEVILTKGSEVTISQALGGTYTIVFEGNMFRISNENADALGKEILKFDEAANSSTTLEEKIWAQLQTCYDPEIPVNIVDLGLIYDVTATPIEKENIKEKTEEDIESETKKEQEAEAEAETETEKKVSEEISPEKQYSVTIKMTLTAPGCGMGPIIAAEARQKVLSIPEVNEVNIEMIFDPPWDTSRMSDAARLMLNM